MEDFMNLKHGRITVKEYSLMFHQLSRYAPSLVANMWTKIRNFYSGLNQDMILESKAAFLIKDMQISR